MKSVAALPLLKGKKVLIRVGYDVPLKGNVIEDTRRIESSYKTIDTVLKKGGVPILVTHIGRKGDSLKPVATFLSKKYKVLFLTTPIEDEKTKELIARAQKNTVVLLENIRTYSGEEINDKALARSLASLGDYYVNDSFSVAHRKHASIVGVPKYLPSYAGYQLQDEIEHLQKAVRATAHPFLLIIGGAKFETKIPVIEQFLGKADSIVIAGAILNTFYKTAGFEVGTSVVEPGYETIVKKLLRNPKLLLPTDILVQNGKKRSIVAVDDVKKTDKIVDIGSQSITLITEKIKKAKLVVWNGPTGWYEAGFDTGTIALAEACTQTRAQVVVGGGDTAAVIENVLGDRTAKKKNIFLSTGGGATLEFLSKGTLPGIEALGK